MFHGENHKPSPVPTSEQTTSTDHVDHGKTRSEDLTNRDRDSPDDIEKEERRRAAQKVLGKQG